MSRTKENSNLYTTGEIARLCGVSVRTVQYYDDRGILIPSELSEGGRRLYTEEDVKRMRIICFLRETGLPINSISALFAEKNPKNIISILLEQQEEILREELAERQTKLDLLNGIKHELKEIPNFSVASIGDIAHMMKQKNKLRKMRWMMILTGIPVTALQWTSIVLWITNGFWWLFAVWVGVAALWGCVILSYYFHHVAYICPQCHEVFNPSIREVFWAYHTPKMRRLICPKCGYHGLCVEVYAEKKEKNNA
jgi:DNA-binding transcriptional MerR regulator